MRKALWIVGGTAALLAAAFVATNVEFYKVCAYVDRNTASMYGYREWPTGQRTGSWYRTSPLEAYIEAHWPGTVRHRWVSCAGTGKSLFGQSLSFGHGASTGAFHLKEGVLNPWIDAHSPEEVRGLYRELSSASFEDSRKIAQRVLDEAASLYRSRTNDMAGPVSDGQAPPQKR